MAHCEVRAHLYCRWRTRSGGRKVEEYERQIRAEKAKPPEERDADDITLWRAAINYCRGSNERCDGAIKRCDASISVWLAEARAMQAQRDVPVSELAALTLSSPGTTFILPQSL